MTAPRTIPLTECAKFVRAALKRAYPAVKFQVRCSRYSMGQSIDVSWWDGPTVAQVDTILKPFCGQRFDGTDDSTHSLNGCLDGEVVHFQSDYVTGNRQHSAAFLRQIAAKVARQYGRPVPEISERDGFGIIQGAYDSIDDAPPFNRPEMLRDVIYHVMHQTSALPKPRIRIMPDVREVA